MEQKCGPLLQITLKMVAGVQASQYTHILLGLVGKLQFLICDLGPKIWPGGPNYLKYECWGRGKSIDTHIVRFCEKIAIFKFGAKGPLDPKFGPGFPIVSNMNAGVEASP